MESETIVNDSVNKITDFYDSISAQAERENLASDSVFLVGDFNEIHQMSNNGARLNDIMEKYNLAVLNTLKVCSGTFIWVKNNISVEKSVLDHVITSQDLVSSVNSLKVDQSKEFTPWSKRGKHYSDHNAILVHMSVTKHSKKDKGKRKLVWNFNDPLGWETFHKITSSDRSSITMLAK